ncbi:MAG: tripartite tricarboxylate transporter substrate binding protein [Hyphomicrobiales bacterium]|nr:tripartite tricarboxylate transporter substrate binding protein [Hyphomicrobiales bacterium]
MTGVALASLALAFFVPGAAYAQDGFPNRPIRLIAPSPPAGVHDVVGRLWAERIKATLGTVIVENRPGAGTIIGAAEVVKAAPDGYTLLLGSTSSHVVAPVTGNPNFDPMRDLEPIALLTTSATSIAVTPSLPVKNLMELVAYAKARPGKLSYGSAGLGSMSHLTGELFKTLRGGIDMVHVPYKGAGPGIADLISGHIPVLTPNATGQVLQLHQSGSIRVLAVNAPERLKAAPNIPTAVESGMPEMNVLFFCGLFAPAGTPKNVIDLINKATQSILRSEQFQDRLVEMGYQPMQNYGPAESRTFIRAEQIRWAPIIKASGAKPE